MSGLEGKVAIVTGAGTGIGRDIGLALARQGVAIVAVGRRLAKVEETAHLVEEEGGKALAVSTDVSKAGDVQGMVDASLSAFGRLDILVNNAGVVIPGTPGVLKVTEEQWDWLMSINLKGVFLCSKSVAPIMMEGRWGRIINIASVGGVAPSVSAAYCASKAGVVALTKSMALEFSSRGVTVNVICPGTIVTDMTRDRLNDPGIRSAQLSKTLVGQFGEPPDVSAGVVYLASPSARFITGSVFVVDGGWTIS